MANPAELRFRWILCMALTLLSFVAIILHIVLAAHHHIDGKRFSNSINHQIAGTSITGYLISFLLCGISMAFGLGYVDATAGWRAVWRLVSLVAFMLVSIAAGLGANSNAGSSLVNAVLVFDLLYMLVLSISMIVGPGEPRAEDREFFFSARPTAVYIQIGLLFLYLILAIPAFIIHCVAASTVHRSSSPSGTGLTGLLISIGVVSLALLDILKGFSKVYEFFVTGWHVLAMIAYFFLSFTVGEWTAALKYLAVASHVLDLLCLLVLMAHIFTFRALHDVPSVGLYTDRSASNDSTNPSRYGTTVIAASFS